MTAAMLVLEPIFEADLPSELYAYRPGRNAQQAVVAAGELLFRAIRKWLDHEDLNDQSDGGAGGQARGQARGLRAGGGEIDAEPARTVARDAGLGGVLGIFDRPYIALATRWNWHIRTASVTRDDECEFNDAGSALSFAALLANRNVLPTAPNCAVPGRAPSRGRDHN